MNNDLTLPSIALHHGEAHRIDDGRGLRVQCLTGTLWLTQDGDRRDIVLEAGDGATIERDGLSIGEAAFLAGYSNPANFTTAFRRAFGILPKAIKR